MKKLICLILIGFFTHNFVSGQVVDSTKKENKVKIIPLPAIFYTPETRFGFGALTSFVFNFGDKATTRNSNFQVLAAYTLNKQIILQSKHNIFAKDESMAYNGELSYYDFPILYYGVGNNTLKEFEENLAYQVVIFRERVLKKVKENLFIGIQYRFTNLYDIEFQPKFLINETERIETQKGKNSGAGFSIVYDNRDNVLNARTGMFLEFSNFFHSKSLGGDFDFNRYTVDLRKYWTLTENDVIATQYFGEFNTSNTPFREMSLLGGETIMRGYYNGRYRDNQQMALQGEYRRQILPWLGLTAFSAFGDVAPSIDQFDLQDFKWTAGGGLRFMVNKSDRINIRIDYGVGQNTSGFYFAFAEAF
jgi:outer membrane protein assembly factor BamA